MRSTRALYIKKYTYINSKGRLVTVQGHEIEGRKRKGKCKSAKRSGYGGYGTRGMGDIGI